MRPSDIESLIVPGTPTLCGDLLLVSVARPDVDRNLYVSAVHHIGLDGTEQAWSGGPRDTDPVISPDGEHVAFLRAGPDRLDKPQVHVARGLDGAAVAVTDLPLGAGTPVWAPDSRRIAFIARSPEPGRYGTDPDVSGPEEAPRLITRPDYRMEQVGFTADQPARLYVLDAVAALESSIVPNAEPLNGAGMSVSDPAWCPDGRAILVSGPADWGKQPTERSDLYRIPTDGGAPEVLVHSTGTATKPVVSADGTVFYFGATFPGNRVEARNTGLWRLMSGGVPERMTDTESVDCAVAAGRPVVYGDQVLVAVVSRGAVLLGAVPRGAIGLALTELTVLTGKTECVRAFSAAGERIVATIATEETAGEVALLEAGTARVLTDFSAPLRATGLRRKVELSASAPDGYPVHGWLTVPEGTGPHPVLLLVHGGPFAAYDWAFFDETQVYVAAGYAVVQANPRGSAGYGESHGRAILRRLGTVDADDVLALLDEALRRPELDAKRVGVMGGSYGGFMTSWLAAHHGDRFVAAWSERAVNAWDSMTGTSDIGWSFVDEYVGPEPTEQRTRSPLSYADQINIPFAIAHSENDWRCPIEQAQRMFVALYQNNADVEFLMFPGEGHELTRSGQPRHRRQRFVAVLDWWRRKMPAATTGG